MTLGADTAISQHHGTLGKDTIALFESCRKGDLSKIRHLVEEREIELNIRDRWDGTPLYYACLCGHKEVVEYLLDNGARCVANTFDGERCLYASLNVGIRNLLRDHKVVTSNTMRRDGYDQFLRRCLDDRQHCDITFRVGGEEVRAHRCILAARSEFFRDAFRTKWRGHNVVPVTHHLVDASVFRIMLQYLYTGRLEMQARQSDSLIELAKRCRLTSLVEQLHDLLASSSSRRKAWNEFKTLLLEPSQYAQEVQRDLCRLAEQTLPSGDCEVSADERLTGDAGYADVCFNVHGCYFFCHKVLFCNRSDYFRALIEDPFTEALSTGTSRDVPVISLNHVTPEVLKCVVQHVYGNTTTALEPANVWEVACVADVYLLPELRRQCGQLIGERLDEAGACSALKVARLLRLHRLEEQCIDFMARHLAQVVQRPEFREIVAQDASEVKLRQETDSISVIDDIRYHIAANARSCAEVALANQKLALIDALLSDMGLDA